MDHTERQRRQHDAAFADGSRQHAFSSDAATRFIVSWRVREGMNRLIAASDGIINMRSSILVFCAGEGLEGSILCDMGFSDVTVSDLSDRGVHAGLLRDRRLKGVVLNAEHTDLPSNSFDVVLVQDGLHHLQSPVQGFTEMLRLARSGVVFLEGHDTLVCHLIGTTWERNGLAINYVFRWNRRLVEQVASSYLGPESFDNLSFTFWHHNIVFAKIAKRLGPSLGLAAIGICKRVMDKTIGRFGNNFCGVIFKKLTAVSRP